MLSSNIGQRAAKLEVHHHAIRHVNKIDLKLHRHLYCTVIGLVFMR